MAPPQWRQQQQQQRPPQLPGRNELARFRRPWIRMGPDGWHPHPPHPHHHPPSGQEEEGGTAATAGAGTGPPPPFLCLSWNVLAASLVDRESYLGFATEEELGWSVRGPRVRDAVRRFDADVVCLQEDDHHEEALAALGKGYAGLFKKRTGADKLDGCSIFWRTRRFRLARAEEIEYLVPGTRHLDRDNVGVVAVLEDLWGQGERGGEGRRRLLVVANTHLLFNPRRGDVKLAQVQMLLRRLEALMAELREAAASSDAAIGLVLAGDFNSTPLSAVYHLLSTGELDARSLNRHWVAGQGRGLMSRNSPLKNMMPYMELAPSAARFRHSRQKQPPPDPTRGPRSLRHFGAGTARGVFRPHRRPPPPSSSSQAARPSQPQSLPAAAAAAAEAEEDAMLRRWAREGGLGSSSSSSSGSSSGEEEGEDSGGSGDEYEGADEEGEEEAEAMDVELTDPALLPAHVPLPLWRFPDEWTGGAEGAGAGAGAGGEAVIRHGLGLQSAYAHRPAPYTTGEPAFTTFHAEFKGTVDYLWFSRGALRCSAILGMPSLEELASQEGLPCAANPSDHLPLLARLHFASDEEEKEGAGSRGKARRAREK